MNVADYIAAGLGILAALICVVALIVVIWCGVTRCPRCGGWHADPHRQLTCEGHPKNQTKTTKRKDK